MFRNILARIESIILGEKVGISILSSTFSKDMCYVTIYIDYSTRKGRSISKKYLRYIPITHLDSLETMRDLFLQIYLFSFLPEYYSLQMSPVFYKIDKQEFAETTYSLRKYQDSLFPERKK